MVGIPGLPWIDCPGCWLACWLYPDGGAWGGLIHVNLVYIQGKTHHNIHCSLAEEEARRRTGMAGANGCNHTGWIAAAAAADAAGGRTGRDSRHKRAAADSSVCNQILVRRVGSQ